MAESLTVGTNSVSPTLESWMIVEQPVSGVNKNVLCAPKLIERSKLSQSQVAARRYLLNLLPRHLQLPLVTGLRNGGRHRLTPRATQALHLCREVDVSPHFAVERGEKAALRP